MKYIFFERKQIKKHIEDLKNQKDGEGLSENSSYSYYNTLSSEEFKYKTKLRFNDSINASGIISFVSSAIYMSLDLSLTISEWNAGFENFLSQAAQFTSASVVLSSLALTSIALYKNLNGKIKDESSLRDWEIEKIKASLVKEHYPKDSLINRFSIEEIVSLGSIYSSMKKEDIKNKSTLGQTAYKTFKLLFSGDKEREQREMFNFVDSLIKDPIVQESKEFYKIYFKESEDNGFFNNSLFDEYVYSMLEKTFDSHYRKFLVEDSKKKILKSLSNGGNELEIKEHIEKLTNKGFVKKDSDKVFFNEILEIIDDKKEQDLYGNSVLDIKIKKLYKDNVQQKENTDFYKTIMLDFQNNLLLDILSKDKHLKENNELYHFKEESKRKSYSEHPEAYRKTFKQKFLDIYNDLNALNSNKKEESLKTTNINKNEKRRSCNKI